MDTKLNAERILNELRYDFHTFSIERFISFVGETKRREIITIPWRKASTLFGAWMSHREKTKEYIFYLDNGPLINQGHIQFHELSPFLLVYTPLIIYITTISVA